ncbi:MAG: transglycosylase domain-containing protein [Polyangiaceae bacterium]|nr:transglycosylase domain-containing protein [Polyangiaceae bacterium]
MTPRGRRLLWAAGAASAVAAAGAASLGPVVRSLAAERAARLGAVVEIGSVRPGWEGLWLRDVGLRLEGVEGVRVRFEVVQVRLRGLELAAVTAHGGLMELSGSAGELEGQLGRWRGGLRGRPGPARDGGPPAVEASLDGLEVRWEGPAGESLRAWGARLSRAGEHWALGADLVRGDLGPAAYELTSAEVSLEGDRVTRRVRSARAATLHATWRAGGPERSAYGPTPPGEPSATAAARVRRLARRAAAALEASLAPSGIVEVQSVRVDAELGPDRLALGPGQLRLERTEDRGLLRVTRAEDAEPGTFGVEAELPLASGPVRVSVRGGPVRLGALGIREGDLGLVGVDRARVTADVTVVLAADDRTIAARGRAALTELGLSSPSLAPQPLAGLRLEASGEAHLESDGSRLALNGVDLTVGTVRATLDAELQHGPDWLALRARGGVPLAACQGLLDSLPIELTPTVAGSRLDGTFSLDGSVAFDSRAPERFEQRWTATRDCRFVQPSALAAPSRFRAPFRRTVPGSDGRPLTLETGPGTADWVPYAAVSQHMTTALLVCEDGRFFRHRGFDQEAIENSLRQNLEARRFVRGASTLTMQLAKNLYLSREKTLARKIEEAFLTVLLEQSFSKEQLLELYLNVVEFGPGIYGIGPAARHWFATTPGALSLPQALYLASILPNPRVQHFGADGRVSAGWLAYLRRLMRAAERLRRVTPEELELALREHPAFRVPSSPVDPAVDVAAPGSPAPPDAPSPEDDPR